MERLSRINNFALRSALSTQTIVGLQYTQQHRRDRLRYAYENLNRDWTNVVFSDEKTFTDRHLKYQSDNIQPTQRVSVWGWISQSGPGKMVLSPGRSSDDYCNMLEDDLMQYVDMQKVVFMHDKHPTHTSQYSRTWFSNNPQLVTLWAPPKSPDLNPLENVWAKIMMNIDREYLRNSATLQPIIVQNWEKLRDESEYFVSLYDSMPYRIREVIRNNGGPTLF